MMIKELNKMTLPREIRAPGSTDCAQVANRSPADFNNSRKPPYSVKEPVVLLSPKRQAMSRIYPPIRYIRGKPISYYSQSMISRSIQQQGFYNGSVTLDPVIEAANEDAETDDYVLLRIGTEQENILDNKPIDPDLMFVQSTDMQAVTSRALIRSRMTREDVMPYHVPPSNRTIWIDVEGDDMLSIPGENNRSCTESCVITRCSFIRFGRFVNLQVFLLFLSALAMFQSAQGSYFEGTSQIWRVMFHLPESYVIWLKMSDELFYALFAIFFSYANKKTHRPLRIGYVALLYAFSGVILLLKDQFLNDPNIEMNTLQALYDPTVSIKDEGKSKELSIDYIALVFLAANHLFYSLSSITTMCYGISYLDDYTSHNYIPIYIVILLSSTKLGKYIGLSLSSLLSCCQGKQNVFNTPYWILFIVIIFITGLTISNFTHRFQRQLLGALGKNPSTPERTDTLLKSKFFHSISRIFKNKRFIINTCAYMFVGIGFFNYEILRDDIFKSKYFLSLEDALARFADQNIEKVLIKYFKQPVIFLVLLVTGLAIVKFKPKYEILVLYSCVCLIVSALFYSILLIVNCPYSSIVKNHTSMSEFRHCNFNCNCDNSKYDPVCVEKTFSSPCHAECSLNTQLSPGAETLNDMCKCGSNSSVIYDQKALCYFDECVLYWFVEEIICLCIKCTLSSAGVVQLLVTIRSVDKADKSLALGFQATFVHLTSYLLFHYILTYIASMMCVYQTDGETCTYGPEHFRIVITAITMALLICASLIFFIVKIKFSSIQMYDENDIVPYHPEFNFMVNNEYATNTNVSTNSNTETSENVLLRSQLILPLNRLTNLYENILPQVPPSINPEHFSTIIEEEDVEISFVVPAFDEKIIVQTEPTDQEDSASRQLNLDQAILAGIAQMEFHLEEVDLKDEDDLVVQVRDEMLVADAYLLDQESQGVIKENEVGSEENNADLDDGDEAENQAVDED